jgi:hypothetical protein
MLLDVEAEWSQVGRHIDYNECGERLDRDASSFLICLTIT